MLRPPEFAHFTREELREDLTRVYSAGLVMRDGFRARRLAEVTQIGGSGMSLTEACKRNPQLWQHFGVPPQEMLGKGLEPPSLGVV